VHEFDCVSEAVAGSDAVAFAVGSGGSRPVTVFSEGIANVVHAMAVHQVRPLAAVSAAGAFARTDPHLSLKFRAMIATSLRATYEDLERMERRIAASDLDWTIIRPVGLSDEQRSGHYRMTLDGSLLKKADRIPREDVAGCVLKALETGAFLRRTLVIGQ
jgi:putative NADH-flavin reductase